MRADLALDIPEPELVHEAVAPSLRGGGRVAFDTGAGEMLEVAVEGRTLGSLRGGVNTALMLARLAAKFVEQG